MPDMPTLTAEKIAASLKNTPDWKQDGTDIVRTYVFKDFVEAMKFVNQIAEAAETACHHPDIDIRWNKVRLALSTHSEGGLTEKDFNLARQFDQLT